STRARVIGLIPGLACSARSTVPVDTPSAFAMSLMPTGWRESLFMAAQRSRSYLAARSCTIAGMHRAALWDLDGTLVDSADYHFESGFEALAAEGRSLTRDQFRASFGQRNDRILAAWLGPDAPRELALRIADVKERAYRRLVRDRGLEALPGAHHWVTRL